MKKIVSTMVLGAAIAACGGAADETPPPQPPPPAMPLAAPTPAPVDTSAAATPAPAAAPTSMSDKIMATLKTGLDALNAHDAKAFGALYTSDAVLKQPGHSDLSGRDAVVADEQKVFDSFPDVKIGARRVFVKDNVAVLEWTMTGTNTGPSPMGGAPTGKPIGINAASVLFFGDDGGVKEEHALVDAPTMMAQLGLMPSNGRPLATLPTGAPEVHIAKGTPDEAKNADEMKAVNHAFETKDAKAFEAANADDITWDDQMAPAPMAGKKAAMDMFNSMAKAFSGLKSDCQVWTFEDWGAQDCVISGKNTGPLVMGPKKIPATNKSVTFRGLDIMQIKDGKAIHGWSYGNGMEMAAQLGLTKGDAKKPDATKKDATKKDTAAAAPKGGDVAKAPKH